MKKTAVTKDGIKLALGRNAKLGAEDSVQHAAIWVAPLGQKVVVVIGANRPFTVRNGVLRNECPHGTDKALEFRHPGQIVLGQGGGQARDVTVTVEKTSQYGPCAQVDTGAAGVFGGKGCLMSAAGGDSAVPHQDGLRPRHFSSMVKMVPL